jgi:hypothetical protein
VVLVSRLRAIDDDGARVLALRRTMEAGVGDLLDRAVALKAEIFYDTEDGLPLELALALTNLYCRSALIWPPAHPEPKVPHVLNTWAILPAPADERAWGWFLRERLPALRAVITDGRRPALQRTAALHLCQFSLRACPCARCFKQLLEQNLVRMYLRFFDELRPAPLSGPSRGANAPLACSIVN